MANQDYTVLFQQLLVVVLILVIIILFYSNFIVKDKFQSEVERENTDMYNYYTDQTIRDEAFRKSFLCRIMPSLC